MKKRYVGDGVYVDCKDGYIVLTTEDGFKVTNTIYLDAVVLEAFMVYLAQLRETIKAKGNK